MINDFLHPWIVLKEELSISQLEEGGAIYGNHQRNTLLKLFFQGKSMKQIADKMKTSLKNVEKHKKILMKRLGVTDNYGLVKYGINSGIIKDPNIPSNSIQLTPRQLSVLKLTAKGMSVKEIAHKLDISERFVIKFRLQTIIRVNIQPPSPVGYIRFALRVFPS